MPVSFAGKRSGWCVAAFFVLTGMMLFGCSAVDNRVRERQAEFNTYPPDIQALIKNGQVRPGFTETQVFIAWGEPYYRGSGQWTYPGFDCKKFQVPKDEYEPGKEKEGTSSLLHATKRKTGAGVTSRITSISMAGS